MDKIAVWATMEALPGKEQECWDFLIESRDRLMSEPGTTCFHAVRLSERQFAILNTFVDEEAFGVHVNGEVASWVKEEMKKLFTGPPEINKADIIAYKRP